MAAGRDASGHNGNHRTSLADSLDEAPQPCLIGKLGKAAQHRLPTAVFIGKIHRLILSLNGSTQWVVEVEHHKDAQACDADGSGANYQSITVGHLCWQAAFSGFKSLTVSDSEALPNKISGQPPHREGQGSF
jgi:hypothetical protein